LISESHLEHLKGVVELFHGARTVDRRGDTGLVLAPEKRKLASRQTATPRRETRCPNGLSPPLRSSREPSGTDSESL
jgi:hypothetical protein